MAATCFLALQLGVVLEENIWEAGGSEHEEGAFPSPDN